MIGLVETHGIKSRPDLPCRTVGRRRGGERHPGEPPEVFAGGTIIGGLPYGTSEWGRPLSGCDAIMPGASARCNWPSRPQRPAGGKPRHLHLAWITRSEGKASQCRPNVHQWASVRQVSDAPDVIESINGDSREIWLSERGNPSSRSISSRAWLTVYPCHSQRKLLWKCRAVHAGGRNFVDRTRGWLRDTGSIRPR